MSEKSPLSSNPPPSVLGSSSEVKSLINIVSQYMDLPEQIENKAIYYYLRCLFRSKNPLNHCNVLYYSICKSVEVDFPDFPLNKEKLRNLFHKLPWHGRMCQLI